MANVITAAIHKYRGVDTSRDDGWQAFWVWCKAVGIDYDNYQTWKKNQ
jgi:hypothetical protein